MLWCAVSLSAGFAIGSLAIDFARVQLAKTQLRAAVDATARYAVTGLVNSTHVAKAIAAAADNTVDGSAVSIGSGNVEKGNFNTTTKTFVTNGVPNNAVRITYGRTGVNGVALALGRVIGMPRCNINATAVGYIQTGTCGFTGLDGFVTKNNGFIGNYDSSADTSPGHSNADGQASVGSNGTVDCGSLTISGNLQLGPSGTVNGVSYIDGGAVQNSTVNIPSPTMPAWSPSGNPGGISQSYSVGSTTSLPAGTYYFTSLTVSGNLSFLGAATVYVNGDVNLSGSLKAYQMIPSNLTVYQLGSGRTFGNSGANGITVCADVIAPGADFVAKNNLEFYGSGFFKTVDVKNNCDFYYDVQLGKAAGVPQVSIVK